MIPNFDLLCIELEKQELEAQNGIASPTVYAQLLAIYLYQNDLCNAKLLWKRIPQIVTCNHPEVTAIWTIGQRLWKKDYAGTYQAFKSYNWSESVANIIEALEEKVRSSVFNLIGRSYSSISLDAAAAMTGLSKEALIQIANDLKWTLNDDGVTVHPTPKPQPAPLQTSSEDQLYKLTDFVSFLEN